MGRQQTPTPHLVRQSPKGHLREGRSDEGLDSISFARLDPTGQLYLFFVGKHAPPRRADRGWQNIRSYERRIVGHGNVGQRL
jgi:hypothetical protein